jgi:hypothetical protein
MPGPRAAAVAVMATLAFGIVVGSIAGGTSVATLASAPLIVVGLNQPTSSSAANNVTTVTDTGPSDAGAPGAANTAAAATPAQASASPSTTPTSGSGTSPS